LVKVRREAVLDVYSSCDRVLSIVNEKGAGEFFAGVGRLLEKGERRGSIVLTFASASKGRFRIEVSQSRGPEKIIFTSRGDLDAEVTVTVTPRGGACRVYVEAEGEGPLIDEYGGEALSRVVNRIVTVLVSLFPAVLQPRLPMGRLGDVFVDLLSLLSIAHEGPTALKAKEVKSFSVNLDEKRILAADGIPSEAVNTALPYLAEALSNLSKAFEKLGVHPPQRIALVAGDSVVYTNITGGIAVFALLRLGEKQS
jgi:hypothetical protein